MKNIVIIFIYFLLILLLFTQCQQPRPDAEFSSDPGARLFLHYCSRCHLDNGIGGPAPGGGIDAADIRHLSKNQGELESIISNGFGQMPPFRDSLSLNDVSSIAHYVATQIETQANSQRPQQGDDKFK